MTTRIDFTVRAVTARCEPVAQPRPRGRIIYPKRGRPMVSLYSPLDTRSDAAKLDPDTMSVGEWKDRVARAGREFFAKWAPIENPIRLCLTFYMPRPDYHFHKPRGVLERIVRVAAAIWHVTTPDLDNLQKAVMDALKGICWKDDSQVCQMYGEKRYVRPGEVPGVRIVITQPEPDFAPDDLFAQEAQSV